MNSQIDILKKYIIERIKINLESQDEMNVTSNAIKTSDVDEFDMVYLIYEIEKWYNINITNEELLSMNSLSLGKLIEIVEKHVKLNIL